MADMEVAEATEAVTDDPGCGCCRPDPKTAQDVIRELQARRDDLDRRLARLELVGASR
ncbi:MAG TPA: hypothetical protein VHN78_02950 [Chloroflexota bacterium]|nr:hypothetical protein [Chloroflexota bacterium]